MAASMTIEALLQDNIGGVQELDQTSQKLKQAIETHLEPLDAAVTGKVVPAVTAAISRMGALNEALVKLDSKFDTAAKDANGKLDEFDKEIEGITTNVNEANQTIDTVLDQIEGETSRAQRSFDTNVAAAQRDFDQVAAATKQLSEEIAERAKFISSHPSYHDSWIATHFGELDQEKQGITSDLETIQQDQQSRLTAAKTSIETVMESAKQRQYGTLEELNQEVATQHQEVSSQFVAAISAIMLAHANVGAEYIQAFGNAHEEVLSGIQRGFKELAGNVAPVVEEIQESERGLADIVSGL